MDKLEDARFKIKNLAQVYKHKSDAQSEKNDILHAAYHHIGQGLLKALSIIEGGFDDNGVIPSIISESDKALIQEREKHLDTLRKLTKANETERTALDLLQKYEVKLGGYVSQNFRSEISDFLRSNER